MITRSTLAAFIGRVTASPSIWTITVGAKVKAISGGVFCTANDFSLERASPSAIEASIWSRLTVRLTFSAALSWIAAW